MTYWRPVTTVRILVVDEELFHVKPSETGVRLSLAELQARIERRRDPAELEHELGDALAWLTSVANLVGVDLERAAGRFASGCPRCGHSPCDCPGG